MQQQSSSPFSPMGHRAEKALLLTTALLCGALIMVVEVLGSRVIGPFFGVSLFVWSSLIAVTMIALAAGYALGGRLADRHPHPDWLYGLILAAGVLVCLIPVLRKPVLLLCVPMGLRLGAFASSLLLFGPCLLLLGCVSPYLVRIAIRDMQAVGRTVGGLYAVSTVGSVAGTLLTGFFLIVYVGVNTVFLLVGGLLILMAALYFALLRRRFPPLAALAVPLVLSLAGAKGPVTATLPSGTKATVVASVDSHYGNLKIVDYQYGPRHVREMILDGSVQSGIDMQNGQAIYPYFYLQGILPYGINPEGKSCLVVGVGGGIIPAWFQERGIRTDTVDIDPEVFKLAHDYFNYRPNGGEYVEDARAYLAGTQERYDYVILDVFNGESAPAHIISLEALQLTRSRMTERGVLAINFHGRLSGDRLMTASVVRTLREIFDQVEIYPNFDPNGERGSGNINLIAYDGAPANLPADYPLRFALHPRVRNQVLDYFNARFSFPADEPSIILRDDYNPIDCYDNAVREETRRDVLATTPWEILLSALPVGRARSAAA